MKGLRLDSRVSYWYSVDLRHPNILRFTTATAVVSKYKYIYWRHHHEKLKPSICFRRKSKPVGSKTANVAFEINKHRDFFLAHWTELLFLHERRILKQALEVTKALAQVSRRQPSTPDHETPSKQTAILCTRISVEVSCVYRKKFEIPRHAYAIKM